MSMFRALFGKPLALAAIAAAVVSLTAHADDSGDVNALLQARRFDAALAKASAYLEKNPRDPQMRFMQGLSLTNLGRQSEAITVFTALTTDFPDLAEPYNNLAVLHAANRQYDSARDALEKAIRVDPNYATAYENLADLYLQLANQAYAKALQLNPNNTTVRMRLAQIGKTNERSADRVPTAAVTKTSMRGEESEKEAALAVVKEWARSWSARDVNSYLTYYGPEFRTPHQEPRSAWEAKRRELIENKAKIEVGIESPQISLTNNVATVRYRQKYVSDSHVSNERKTLVLRKYDDSWKIVEERSGN
jgi:tetratricopeptide (TPR) repeat protein